VVIAGTGLPMPKFVAVDVPPPGAGLVTVTFTFPEVAISAAVIAAVTCVALTNVVVTAVPLKVTVEVETKPVPFTVKVKAAPPTWALAGESVVIVGTGFVTVKFVAEEVPPPGAGFVTVTLNVPADAIAGAVIVAVNCVALTNVVVAAVPLKFTTEEETKPVPFTVSVKAALPSKAVVGEMVVIAGVGFVMVKVAEADVPPPGAGLVTVTPGVPAVEIKGAVIAAVNCVALTNVVVTFVPLKLTKAPLTNPVPLTVSVKAAPPSTAVEGESVVIVGRGFVTEKVAATDVPPPGVGLATVTLYVAAVARSAIVTGIVNWLEFTNVVVLAVPLKLATELETKLDPLIVRVNAAPPTRALEGESVAITGRGLFTVKVCEVVVPPPGVGFVTDTLSVPPSVN
jgi:hypothetical protein